MPAPAPVPTRPDTLAVPELSAPALGGVGGEGAVAHSEGVGPKRAAAVARNDRASEAFADQDHGAAAGVAVAADGRVVVEGAAGDGDRDPNLSVEGAPLCAPDPDDVGPVAVALLPPMAWFWLKRLLVISRLVGAPPDPSAIAPPKP